MLQPESPVEDWIKFAQENLGDHSSSNTVFVSYASEDSRWLSILQTWCGTELRGGSNDPQGQPFELDHFSAEDGTTDGSPYPPKLAEQMWRCKAVIIVASQTYFQKRDCYSVELPFLAWRERFHGLRIWVLKVGVTTASPMRISLPLVEGDAAQWRLDAMAHDAHPRFNAGLPDDHGGVLIEDLPENFRKLRLRNFANEIAEKLRERPTVQRATASEFSGAGQAMTSREAAEITIGKFPPVGVFKGRRGQIATLKEAASGAGVAVASISEIGGQGKTALGLKFIEEMKFERPDRFEGYFKFTFYNNEVIDKDEAFAEELSRFLLESLGESGPVSPGTRINWLVEVLRRRRVMLFLDGVEEIQSSLSSHDAGALHDGVVKKVLTRLCQVGEHAASFVFLTSRLPFRDLARSGGSYLPIPLGGLSPAEGADALYEWGIVAPRGALEDYTTGLGGHPLGLLAFANSVDQTYDVLRDQFGHPGAVAAYVAEKAAFAEAGTPHAKVQRMLEYYKGVLTEHQRAVLEIVVLDPDGLRDDWLRQIMRDRFPELGRRADSAALEQILGARVLTGVLQSARAVGHKTYICHPIIKAAFRSSDNQMSPIPDLHLADRPPNFVPRTKEEIEPYLKKIAALAAEGRFKQAAHTLSEKLDSGDLLIDLSLHRELLDCLMRFVGAERREVCLEELEPAWFRAMLPRVVDCCIVLNEWNLAAEFNRLDLTYLDQTTPGDLRLNEGKQAAIEQEIGNIRDALACLARLVQSGSPLDRIERLPELADVERQRGRPGAALQRIRQWLLLRPASINELRSWLVVWDEVLRLLARIGSRASYPGVERFLTAISKALPVGRDRIEEHGWFVRYTSLSMGRRSERTAQDWADLLELGYKLSRAAGARRVKGANAGWDHSIVEAFNGLGQFKKALDEANQIRFDLHEKSWRQIWLDTEIARAHLSLGRVGMARDIAHNAMNSALERDRMLLASDHAELLLEALRQAPDVVAEAAAAEVLASRQQAHANLHFPEFDTLPGEPGWDEYLSKLLIECVTSPESGEQSSAEIDRALGFAAEFNLAGAMRTLLEMGASADGIGGDSPLNHAITAGAMDAVELLLGRRAAIDLSDQQDFNLVRSAIHTAQAYILRRLLQGVKGVTHDVIVQLFIIAAGAASESIVDVLLELDSRIDLPSSDGSLVAVAAAAFGNRAFLEHIQDLVDLSKADPKGTTPLMMASQNGHLNVIDLLADRAVDETLQSKDGDTAMAKAAGAGQVGAVLRLADRFERTFDRDGHLGRALVNAAARGFDADVAAALAIGLNMTVRDDRGWIALTAAARHKQDAILGSRLPGLAGGEIDATDSDGETALMAAASQGHVSTIELLLKHGASPIVLREDGATAFDLALVAGQIDALKALLHKTGGFPKVGKLSQALDQAIDDHSTKLIGFMLDREVAQMLAAAVTAMRLGVAIEDLDQDNVSETHSILIQRLSSKVGQLVPGRLPRDMTDEELIGVRCVLADRSAATFGRLPKGQLPEECKVRLQAHLATEAWADGFDLLGVRGASIPFLPGHWLALLPHLIEPFEIPLIIDEDGCFLADTNNEWLYQKLNLINLERTPEVLRAYICFFFAVIVGQQGAFFFTHRPDEISWSEGVGDEMRDEVSKHAISLAFGGVAEDGRDEFIGTVLFKNAFFKSSVFVNQKWEMELANEELLIEDMPVNFGRRQDLLVRF